MHILLMLTGGFPHEGSSARTPAVVSLVRRLAKANRCTVVTLNQYPHRQEYSRDGAKVINLGETSRLRGRKLKRYRLGELQHLIDDDRPDVIHSLHLGACGALAVSLSQRSGIPLLATLWGTECAKRSDSGVLRGRDVLLGLRNYKVFRHAAALTTPSRFGAMQLPRFAHKVSLGAPADIFSAHSSPAGNGGARLIHIADYTPVKNPALLIQFLQHLKARGFAFHLDWFGYGTNGSEVQKRLENAGLCEVVSTHGTVSQRQLAQQLPTFDLLIQTSVFESQGVAVLEAALAGVPSLGTRVGLVAELAPHAAIACESTSAAMAKTVMQQMQNVRRLKSVAECARNYALQHDADWTAQSFVRLYEQLVKREQPQQPAFLEHLVGMGGQSMHPANQQASQFLLRCADLRSGHRVMEVGCGAGAMQVRLARIEGLEVCGVDVNRKMLDHAHQRLLRLGLRHRVDLAQVFDAQLPQRGESCDRVIVESVLAFQTPDVIKSMLLEIHRCLKPGGLLLMNEGIWMPSADPKLIREANEVFYSVYGMVYTNTEILTDLDWAATFDAAGFDVVANHRLDQTLFAKMPGAEPVESPLNVANEALIKRESRRDQRKYLLQVAGLNQLRKYRSRASQFLKYRQHMESRLYVLKRRFTDVP